MPGAGKGSALMHFYLLEEARAAEPAPSLGARSTAGARWSSRTTSALGLVRQWCHCRELRGHLRVGECLGEALTGWVTVRRQEAPASWRPRDSPAVLCPLQCMPRNKL